MIFIYEPIVLIPNGYSEDYKICYPIKDATNQYKFLSKLDLTTINKIDEIYFLYPNAIDLKLYQNTISDYYPEIDRYKDQGLLKKIQNLVYFLLSPKLKMKPSELS